MMRFLDRFVYRNPKKTKPKRMSSYCFASSSFLLDVMPVVLIADRSTSPFHATSSQIDL